MSKDVREVRERCHTALWGRVPVEGTASPQAPKVGTCWVFKEQQRGQCGWSREQEGERELDEVREKTGSGASGALQAFTRMR